MTLQKMIYNVVQKTKTNEIVHNTINNIKVNDDLNCFFYTWYCQFSENNINGNIMIQIYVYDTSIWCQWENEIFPCEVTHIMIVLLFS